MMIRVLSVVVVVLATVPPMALAQPQHPVQPLVVQAPSPASGTDTDVRQEIRRKRFVVLPRPPMEAVVEDSDRAREELTQPSRRDELIRESRERPLSRPELDYAVTSGIQSRRVLRALTR
ncbi:MAG: hypothetical protein HYU51_11090 [Candidatus Rokubacteria bacterium]|nr:hypothetical protein [Candidatus Rokubacteria bacterium]